MYLKPDELKYASKIIERNPNIIVVIPELNQLNADTDVLNCPNFDYKDYIDVEY